MTVYFPTISPADFEKAMARACIREANRWLSLEPFRCGDESAVRFGAHIRAIATEAGLSLPQARRRMAKLEADGRAMRSDTSGGCTRWWLVGLADAQRTAVHAQVATAAPTPRQAFTAPVPARQHWSDILGVARDDSFRDCTAAYRRQLNDILGDTDANQAESDAALQRLKAAYDAAAKDHDVQVTE